MCNYSGSHFGAPYPDACCIDGYLWDEDSCYEPGGPLYNGGNIPCPACNLDKSSTTTPTTRGPAGTRASVANFAAPICAISAREFCASSD